MSEPAWIPLGGSFGAAPVAKSVVPFVLGEDGLTLGAQWPDGSTKTITAFLPIPVDYAGGDIAFRIARTAGSVSGTAVMRLDAYRMRDGAAVVTLVSGAVIDFGPGHLNTAIQTLYTFPAASFSPGDVLQLRLSRLGADAADTMASICAFSGAWCEYLALSGGAPGSPGLTTVVTTLPASAADGQEVILVDSLTNPTYSWHLRYVAAKASNKWVFVGGAPLAAEAAALVQTTVGSSNYQDLGGPSLTLPLAGDYNVELAARIVSTGSDGTQAYMGYSIGVTAPNDSDALIGARIAGGPFLGLARTKRKVGLGAVTLACRYRGTGSGQAVFEERRIAVLPIAVGG